MNGNDAGTDINDDDETQSDWQIDQSEASKKNCNSKGECSPASEIALNRLETTFGQRQAAEALHRNGETVV